MIVGQNALLSQYVPTFYIKNLVDGQGLKYDAVRKAFVNTDAGAGGGADRLGELLNVSSIADSPTLTLDGQALVYNSFTNLWEGQFVDYNTLANSPLTPGTYGDDHYVPTITVDANGIISAITTQHVDNSARDLIPTVETIEIQTRHQYIVTSQFEIDGLLINNGVLAIL